MASLGAAVGMGLSVRFALRGEGEAVAVPVGVFAVLVMVVTALYLVSAPLISRDTPLEQLLGRSRYQTSGFSSFVQTHIVADQLRENVAKRESAGKVDGIERPQARWPELSSVLQDPIIDTQEFKPGKDPLCQSLRFRSTDQHGAQYLRPSQSTRNENGAPTKMLSQSRRFFLSNYQLDNGR